MENIDIAGPTIATYSELLHTLQRDLALSDLRVRHYDPKDNPSYEHISGHIIDTYIDQATCACQDFLHPDGLEEGEVCMALKTLRSRESEHKWFTFTFEWYSGK